MTNMKNITFETEFLEALRDADRAFDAFDEPEALQCLNWAVGYLLATQSVGDAFCKVRMSANMDLLERSSNLIDIFVDEPADGHLSKEDHTDLLELEKYLLTVIE